ncbi:RPW8 domain-containing protein [Heracleum sosnowskyi]|uniref:RPW8 domain-containing protein n=1 Tax=Heracleum sosnowskyi TaxID=360622 RepID=A0AAD8MSG7_9APIA|nr:RPW8 domain-containing protein [Heracleum sosnowskyi]
MAFIADAGLGIVVGELLNLVIKLNKVLDRPKEETAQFIDQLDCAKKLVAKCSKIPWWEAYKLYVYSKKLEELDKSIARFFSIEVQGFVAVNGLKVAVGVKEVNEKLDLILDRSNISVSGFSSWGSVPGLRDQVIGFDEPLKDLKKMLLKDKKIVTLISAPGGCGKTTLAKMLCQDPEIKGIFKDNILFVTVSKSANICVIVQKMFNLQSPDFQNDDDAINFMEYLLKQKGPSPILLVLDDVWLGWESVIDNLSFTLPYYKILVTSRFSFPRFSPVYNLKILNDQDAMTLFCHSALPKDGSSRIPYDLVEKTANGCKGFPLALTVVGRSLYGHPEVTWRRGLKKWSDGKSIFDTNNELLGRLQISLDALDEMDGSSVKDCCLDLGSFPQGQRIPATTLMDMWAEAYNLDYEDIDTYSNLVELEFRNLVNIVCTRQRGYEVDGYCSENAVIQHDLLRDLIIHQNDQETIEHRKRLIIEITGNDFSKCLTVGMHQPLSARLLSISTDENFSSSWFDLTLPAAEALQLSASWKVIQCEANQIRTSYIVLSRYILTSAGELAEDILYYEIEIDCCDDLVKLHGGVCNIISLKKISITYCNELSELPDEMGRLTNLEALRLSSCTKLLELPESMVNLHKLAYLDISDCLSLSKFPERVGELMGLRTINMRGCQGLSKLNMLPLSIKDLRLLEKVICDEGASRLWKPCESYLKNLNVEEVKEDAFESLMRVISPFQFP